MDNDNSPIINSFNDGHQPPPAAPPAPQQHVFTPLTDTYDNKPKHSHQPSGWKDFISTLGILGTALVVALLMITFVFRSYQVDGPSMQSTLQNQDKLIIWKVPRTLARITGHPYIPNRGDIIVFSESGLAQFNQSDSKQLIKRVIGLPGDRVVIADNKITIFNTQHPNGFDPDKTVGYAYPNFPPTSGNIDVTLKPDQLFVCGDNRTDSLDSRAFGPINADQIIGKLVIRVLPINNIKEF